jgi:hypothetical protein
MFALLLGGTLFGLWGMLLSVPLAGSIQVVLFRLFPKLNAPTPLSLMMPGERPPGRNKEGEARAGAAQPSVGEVLQGAPSEEGGRPATSQSGRSSRRRRE